MLMTETKPHTLYIPTQRCPHCRSANTTMKLIPGEKTHKEHEPVGINKWTCNVCKSEFKPSEFAIAEPILICANCKDMTPHRFVKNEEIQHIPSPDGNAPAPKVATIDTHHHVISHMYSCMTCGTIRVYGCHIGTA